MERGVKALNDVQSDCLIRVLDDTIGSILVHLGAGQYLRVLNRPGANGAMRRCSSAIPTSLIMVVLALSSHAPAQINPVRIPGLGMRLNPVDAYDDSSFLVVWEDWHKSEESDIMGTRVDGNMAVIDSDAIPICAVPRNQCFPAIAVNGRTYFVVWEDYRHGVPAVYGTRVAHGVVLDPEGIRISPAGTVAQHPAVTASADAFFVAWQEADANSEPHIAGARIAMTGGVEDTVPIRISREPGWQARPKVAYDSTNLRFGVVWESHSSEDDTVLIFGARVDPLGVVLDTCGTRLCTQNSRQTEPTIAFASAPYYPLSEYFVAWQDDRRDSVAVCGTWLDSLLTPLHPAGVVVDSSPHAQLHPSVAEQSSYGYWFCMLHWQEHRNGPFWEVVDAGILYNYIQPWGFEQVLDQFDLTTPVYTFGWWGGHGPAIGLTVMTGTGTGIPGIYQTWDEVSGVEEPIAQKADQHLALCPVPTSRFCTVHWTTPRPARSVVQVFDITGRMRSCVSLDGARPGEQSATLDVSGLTPGMYVVWISSAEAHLTGRLVIQR